MLLLRDALVVAGGLLLVLVLGPAAVQERVVAVARAGAGKEMRKRRTTCGPHMPGA